MFQFLLLVSSHCFRLWPETSLNQSVVGCISYSHSLLCVKGLENYCLSFIDFLLTVTGTTHECQVVLILLWKRIMLDEEFNQNNCSDISSTQCILMTDHIHKTSSNMNNQFIRFFPVSSFKYTSVWMNYWILSFDHCFKWHLTISQLIVVLALPTFYRWVNVKNSLPWPNP